MIQTVLLMLALAGAMPANADEIRPALLDIKEQSTGLFAVTWKVPTRNGRSLAIAPKLPASLERVGSPSEQDVAGARVVHTTYKNNSDSLTGQTIVIEGLAAVQTDVLLRVYSTSHALFASSVNATDNRCCFGWPGDEQPLGISRSQAPVLCLL